MDQMCRKALPLVLLAVLGACSDEPTTLPNTAGGMDALSSSIVPVNQIRDVPAVEMRGPSRARPLWETNDSALVKAVAAENGRVVIGLKEQGSLRISQTRTRAAIRAVAIRAGLEMLRGHGAEILHYYGSIGAVEVRIDPSKLPELRNHPLVDYIDPIVRSPFPKSATGSVGSHVGALRSSLGTGSAMEDNIHWGLRMIQVQDAWTYSGKQGQGAKIMLFDTGHERGHPDLPTIPTANCGPTTTQGCTDFAESNYHGTRMMGIWVAKQDGTGAVGVVPGVYSQDMHVWRVCTPEQICESQRLADGLDFAIRAGVRVANMSFSVAPSTTLDNALNMAIHRNMVLITAAGNEGSTDTGYLASWDHILTVSGVREDKTFAGQGTCSSTSPGSNYGPTIDISAPIAAFTTYANGTHTTSCSTSTATVYVSGVASLLVSLYPEWSNTQVNDHLLFTAEPAGDSYYFGYGIVNASRAVRNVTLNATMAGPNVLTAAGTYTWEAMPSGGDGSYTYLWSVYQHSTATYTVLGNGKQQSLAVSSGNGDFTLRATVYSGGQRVGVFKVVVDEIPADGGGGCGTEVIC